MNVLRIKKYLFVLCLMYTTILHAQSLTGTWKGTSEGETVGFTFDKDGFVSMLSDGETLGGKRYEVGGKFYCMKYILSKEGKIRNLDLVMYDLKTNKETQRVLCIVEWISTNQIRICMAMDDPNRRPKDFKNKEDVVILTRK